MASQVLKIEDIELLTPQPTETQPYVIGGYPWGFRLKCNVRYWIETTKNGQREVMQTQDPRSGRWCNPKKSTYSEIVILYKLKANGHIGSYHFGIAYSDEENLTNFLTLMPETFLSAEQQKTVNLARAIFKARKHLTFSIVENPALEQQAEINKHDAEAHAAIPKLVSYYMNHPEVKGP